MPISLQWSFFFSHIYSSKLISNFQFFIFESTRVLLFINLMEVSMTANNNHNYKYIINELQMKYTFNDTIFNVAIAHGRFAF